MVLQMLLFGAFRAQLKKEIRMALDWKKFTLGYEQNERFEANSNSFKDYIVRVASPTNSNREPISKTYSA
jgi:hypothetical protein